LASVSLRKVLGPQFAVFLLLPREIQYSQSFLCLLELTQVDHLVSLWGPGFRLVTNLGHHFSDQCFIRFQRIVLL